jgi:hypothetical protein
MIEIPVDINKKEIWNAPKFFTLDVRKTESGSPFTPTEDKSGFDPNLSP